MYFFIKHHKTSKLFRKEPPAKQVDLYFKTKK